MLALALSVCTSPVHATVFGRDDRGPLPAHHQQLAARIGLLIETRSNTACTAFCVGERVIATAAHCLFRTNGERPPRLTDFVLKLGVGANRQTVRLASGPERSVVAAGSREVSTKPPIDATDDWALARLERPACKDGGLRLSEKEPEQVIAAAHDGRVFQVGYHRDLGDREPAYQSACAVEREFEGADGEALARDFASRDALLLHKCDTGGGSSGSPLLLEGPQGPEVAAISVGTYVQSRVILSNGEVVHRFRSDTVANTAVAVGALRRRLASFNAEAQLATRREQERARRERRAMFVTGSSK